MNEAHHTYYFGHRRKPLKVDNRFGSHVSYYSYQSALYISYIPLSSCAIGSHTLSSRAIGSHTLSSCAIGSHTLSSRALGSHTLSSCAIGSHTLSSCALGSRVIGSRLTRVLSQHPIHV
ncbi:hypothetical protein FJT64_019238 [Amphibalanus amphitrite]|uniref:Uncharacterized protein n=1 Tax=Amphibalanus amphitrite TaxID=1232801 RepID=A0A6A4X5U5_AMPAM|nr:hypothetical protein FJT64_019238 [Amphibalanus amphitrite]